VGFIVASIPLKVAGHLVHQRVEHFYKYRAGDLRLSLWSRLNSRLGICIGLLNGMMYFVLISFFIFNLAYWTTQAAAESTDQPMLVKLANNLGEGLQSSGFSRTAAGVSTLPPDYYQLADFTGLMMQNPQLGPRLATYPLFISLWHRPEMQGLVTDSLLTNSLSTGMTLGEIMNLPSVKDLIANSSLNEMLKAQLLNNLPDLTEYLTTGQSKHEGEVIVGNWTFNAGVTFAWLRQDQPKMPQNEMNGYRALWSQAYGPMALQFTCDNQVYVKNLPKFAAQVQNNQPLFEGQNATGDWTKEGAGYTVHVTAGSEDKYLSATTDGLRLKIKDGRKLLIFDHAD
jgi:hypothetical protein